MTVSFNDENLLKGLFRSLKNQDYWNYEVVLVDNASNSSVREFAKTHNARYVRAESNLGYTGGNNLGVSCAKGDIILILNPDTRVSPTSLSRMVHALSDHGPHCMVVVPKVMIKDSNQINSVGMRRFHKRANLYANIGYLETDHGQYDQPTRVEAFDGAAFIFRRSMLSKTYLFNPFYFGGEETPDLAERIRSLGYEIWTCPHAVVKHELHATFRDDPLALRVRPTMIRNSLAHTLTNRGVTAIILTALTLIHFSLVRIRQREFLTAKHYIQGIVRFILDLGRIIRSTAALRGGGEPSGSLQTPRHYVPSSFDR